MARVYISSTSQDLQEQREAAARAVRRLECEPINMENYTAGSRPPLEKCLADVRNSDIYVGIIAWRYGAHPPGMEQSFTRLEFEEAQSHQIPSLLFLLEEGVEWPKKWRDEGADGAGLQAFREHVAEKLTVRFFSRTPELETHVTAAVSLELQRSGGRRVDIPELLPYLSDRSRQRDQLADALYRHREKCPRRPMVVFVHGHEREAHGEFLERLKRKTLPDLLDLKGSEPVHQVRFEWGPRRHGRGEPGNGSLS